MGQKQVYVSVQPLCHNIHLLVPILCQTEIKPCKAQNTISHFLEIIYSLFIIQIINPFKVVLRIFFCGTLTQKSDAKCSIKLLKIILGEGVLGRSPQKLVTGTLRSVLTNAGIKFADRLDFIHFTSRPMKIYFFDMKRPCFLMFRRLMFERIELIGKCKSYG